MPRWGQRGCDTVAKIYRIEIYRDGVAGTNMRTDQSCGNKRVDRDAFDMTEPGKTCPTELFQRYLVRECRLPRRRHFLGQRGLIPQWRMQCFIGFHCWIRAGILGAVQEVLAGLRESLGAGRREPPFLDALNIQIPEFVEERRAVAAVRNGMVQKKLRGRGPRP